MSISPDNVSDRDFTSIDNAMLDARAAGFSIIPIDHKTKQPVMYLLPKRKGKASWAPYQAKIADETKVSEWTNRCEAFAVVCGGVSGGLLVLDFDVARFYHAWCEAVGPLVDNLPVQQTGGGGYQVFLRTDDPGGSEKLAWAPDKAPPTGRTIAIETKGANSYCVVPPSSHPSGQRYQWIRGGLGTVPCCSREQTRNLLEAARRLDEAPQSRQQLERAAKTPVKSNAEKINKVDVIGKFNEAVSIREMLQRAGYTIADDRFIRPGGKSASVVVFDEQRSYHFSTNDRLNDSHAHDSFSILCEYEHGGDVKATVKAAAKELGLPEPQTLSHTDIVKQAKKAEQVFDQTETLAKLSLEDFAKAKIRLKDKFGSDLNLKDLESAVARKRHQFRSLKTAAEDVSSQYEQTPNGIIWKKPTREGMIPVQLTNFRAKIIADVVRDDGADQEHHFVIEASLRNRTPTPGT